MSAQQDQPKDQQPEQPDTPETAGARADTDPAGATPQGEAPQAGLDALEALQARLDQLVLDNEALKEQALRAAADAENARRRAQDEVTKARKFGIESFAESLVPVKDSLEAALSQGEQNSDAWREGVETTLRQLNHAFERNRLAEIAPAPGERFDPHQHQAISTVPAEQPANTVVQTLQKGYLIADRVLRPALVTVASGNSA